jgi:hypothetical protein
MESAAAERLSFSRFSHRVARACRVRRGSYAGQGSFESELESSLRLLSMLRFATSLKEFIEEGVPALSPSKLRRRSGM